MQNESQQLPMQERVEPLTDVPRREQAQSTEAIKGSILTVIENRYRDALDQVRQAWRDGSVDRSRLREVLDRLGGISSQEIDQDVSRLNLMPEEEGIALLRDQWVKNKERYPALPGRILRSLAGIDQDTAWELRKELTNDYTSNMENFFAGLAGLDSEQAWYYRDEQLKKRDGYAHIAESLVGLDTERAWTMREKIQSHVVIRQLLSSLLGCLN